MKNTARLFCAALVLLGYNATNTFAQALNFGAYSYVTLGAFLPANHSYTKEAWVKVYPTKAVHGRNFISAYDHPFWLENGMLSAANRYGAPPHAASVQDKQTFPLNQWVHIAVTYDPHSTTMVLYKNGKVVAVDSAAPGYEHGIIQLGADGSGDFLDGTDMDEVRIWNVALTQAQIQANMNCEVQPQDSLLAYYKFNEGTPGGKNKKVLSAMDYSGHSNSGAFFNFSMAGTANNYVKGRAVSSAAAITGATMGCIDAQVALNDATKGGSWNSSNACVATISLAGVFTGVSVGTTVISYSLANGCPATKTMSVHPSPTISARAISEGNEEGYNGSITTAVAGGTAPYNYTWSNNATTPNLNGLKEGIYKVTVTDAAGCTASGAYIITRPVAAFSTNTTVVSKPYSGIQKP